MITDEYGESISEVLDILEHTREEDVLKISPKFMEFLKNNSSKTYVPKLDHTKEIKDMNLSTKTKTILAIIYKKFWCSEEEAKTFDRKLNVNEANYQLELQQKYDADKLFKKKSEDNKIDYDTTKSKVFLVEYEQSIFKKFINKIKRFFI